MQKSSLRASTHARARTSTTHASSHAFVRVELAEEDARATDEFIRTTLRNASNSVNEIGNVRFDVLRSLSDGKSWTFVETYADEETEKNHATTAHSLAWREMKGKMKISTRVERYNAVVPSDEEWTYANATKATLGDEDEMKDASVTHVYCRVKAKDAEAFRAACAKNAANSVLEEDNLRFDVFQNAEDKTKFVLVEVYATQAAVSAHKETAHYKEWRDRVESMMAEPRVAVKYRAMFPVSRAGWREKECEDACDMQWA